MVTLWVDMITTGIDADFADKPDEIVQLTIAYQLANIIIETESCLYSQWFPGEENIVPDLLSCDFHLTSDFLANHLELIIPDQVPLGLKIFPLPTEIASWLTLLLLNQPQKEPWSKEPTRSKTALGLVSNSTYYQLDYKMTHSWTTSITDKNKKFSVHLLNQSERVDFLEQQKLLNLSQSEPPWTVWHRPTSWLTDQIQGWTPMEDLYSFYNASFEDIQP
jgi:hypothetical protein